MRQRFDNKKREQVKQIGKTFVEGVASEDQRRSVKDKYEEGLKERVKSYTEEAGYDSYEEVLSDDTDLYSTLQADMIEEALEPQLLAEDVIRSMDFQLEAGYDSIQIPSGNQLSAVSINSDGSLSEDTTGYDSISVSINWVGVRTTFSGQIINKNAVDLLAFRMEQAGRAIARKVDSDILNEIEKAGTKGDGDYGDNSNYVYTGSGVDVTYGDFITALETGLSNDAALDTALLSPSVWGRLHEDADMKDVLAFTATSEGEFALVQQFGPLRMLASSQVPADKALLVDTDKTAMFVDAAEVETYDGRVSENWQFEVLAVKGYGVGILQPQTIVVIHQDADEPA